MAASLQRPPFFLNQPAQHTPKSPAGKLVRDRWCIESLALESAITQPAMKMTTTVMAAPALRAGPLEDAWPSPAPGCTPLTRLESWLARRWPTKMRQAAPMAGIRPGMGDLIRTFISPGPFVPINRAHQAFRFTRIFFVTPGPRDYCMNKGVWIKNKSQ